MSLAFILYKFLAANDNKNNINQRLENLTRVNDKLGYKNEMLKTELAQYKIVNRNSNDMI